MASDAPSTPPPPVGRYRKRLAATKRLARLKATGTESDLRRLKATAGAGDGQ
jgi:hypothetical protein